MNKLKPYMLWVVSGVLFLVLVILLAVVSPSVDIGGQNKDAYEVKNILDGEAKKLKALSKRARTGDPLGIYDPQSGDDIRKLTNDYLLTNRWLDVINPHVSKYTAQIGQIREDLQLRSKGINEPVAATSDKLQWYLPYEKLTGELVSSLRDAGCIVMPTDSTVRRPQVAPPGGQPGMPGAAPAAGANAANDAFDPQKNPKIRSIVGLFTSEGDLPEPDQHPLLTTRFRIVERIASAVIKSSAETLPNPVVTRGVSVNTPAAIASWEWKQDSTADQLDPPVGDYAKPVRFTVTLEGTESGLTAALANIESLDRPILVVLGSTLSRIERVPAGSRMLRDANEPGYAAPARLEVNVLVLDFTQMGDVNAGGSATPNKGGAPGMPNPGMSGMPPGMPGAPRAPTPSSDGGKSAPVNEGVE